jgi:hypothetical protein
MSTEPGREAKGSSSSNAKPSNQSDQRLPFEPRQKRKKTPKTQPAPAASEKATKLDKKTPVSKEAMAIPDAVSKRMVRRMAL